jgi:glycine dehydrogenase subunit 2
MMTCPNTLGLFECHLEASSSMVHDVDALLYYDGANLNAIMGKMRVGDVGFDVVHVNLHKTFATPHGGGGPGSGPVGVCARLVDYLPISRVVKLEDGQFFLNYDYPKSIGYIAPFYGNFGVVLKAYAYILRLGREALSASAKTRSWPPTTSQALEEAPGDPLRPGVHARVRGLGRAAGRKRRARAGHRQGPSGPGLPRADVYFPLIVKECLMFEPTETETRRRWTASSTS